jgi:SAM-dependent methyltransferase
VPAPQPDQYDAFAHEYEAHAEVAPYNALYDRPATLALLGDVAGLRVLDAACGPGLYLEELLARGADAVGCDGSPAMVELARARVGGRAEVRVQSLDEPITWVPDGSIDLVVCALAYHYLNDRPAFLAEARRVLRPDGALVISTHHPTDDWRRLGGSYFTEEPVTETWSKGWTITAWRLPLSRLTAEFADAGFVIERLEEPLPDPAMASSHPHTFEVLSNMPAFVLFRLRPRPG